MKQLAGVDLNLLVALDALLTERHVTRAGRRIGLSQSAMSHALARLRDLLADPILVRTARGMQPTALGERMAGTLPGLLEQIRRALDQARGRFDPASDARRVVIATSDYGGAVLVPALAQRLARAAPAMELLVRPLPEAPPVDDLERGAVDLVVGTFLRVPESLREHLLYREEFVCAVRRDHPRIRGRLSLEQYASTPHVLVASPGEGPGTVDAALAARGRERRVAVRVPHFLVAPAVVAQTDYVVTLAGRLARQAARVHRLRLLRPPIELPGFRVLLLWHPRADTDPAGAWLRQQLIEVARGL